MKHCIVILLDVVAVFATAEVRFSPLNVREVQGVVGVTHDELRAAIREEDTALRTDLVPKTTKVNNHALSGDITLTPADVHALPLAGGTLDDDAEITLQTNVDTQGGRDVVKVTPLGIDIYEFVRGTTLTYLASFGSDITLYGGNLTVRNPSGVLGGQETIYTNGEIQLVTNGSTTGRLTLPNEEGMFATREYVSNEIINHTSIRFSNEVLAVGLNLDPEVAAEISTLAALFDQFPVEGAATTVGGLLAALAVAILWLRKTKQEQLFVLHPGGETRVLIPNGVNKDAQKKFIADNPDFTLSFTEQSSDKWLVEASGYDTTKYHIENTYYLGPDPVANKKSIYVELLDADNRQIGIMISAVGTVSVIGDEVDLEPAEDSDALVTSGGVYKAIRNSPSMLYDPETDEYYQMIEK